MFKKLTALQAELKAPKNQHNKFGGYNYRNLEDILEALKPLLKKHGLSLVISDDIVQVGERFYVKATATLHDVDSDAFITTSAFAREALDAKGMSEPQLTGSSSSYARKYCMNAMFLIDDTKDDDTNEARIEKNARAERRPDKPKEEYITEKEQNVLRNMCERIGRDVNKVFPNGLKLTPDQYAKALATLKGWGA